MLNTTIDFRTALLLLVNIVKEFGYDHTPSGGGSNGCVYFELSERSTGWGDYEKFVDNLNLRPVCIVGQAFARLGIARALMANEEVQHSTCSIGASLWDNAEAMGVTFTDEAQRLLREAQAEQDAGVVWGKAVERAVKNYQDQRLNEFKAESGIFDGYAVEPLYDLRNLADDSPF